MRILKVIGLLLEYPDELLGRTATTPGADQADVPSRRRLSVSC